MPQADIPRLTNDELAPYLPQIARGAVTHELRKSDAKALDGTAQKKLHDKLFQKIQESIKAEWQAFSSQYTDNQQDESRAQNLRLFHGIVFGNGLKTYLKTHEIHTTEDPKFKELFFRIKDICLESAQASKKPYRLNTIMTAALIQQWTDVESQFGLYPPKSTQGSLKSPRNQAITQSRGIVLDTPAGHLLSDALYALNTKYIDMTSARLIRKNTRLRRIPSSLIETASNHIFNNALFAYNPQNTHTSFRTYLTKSIELSLYRIAKSYAKKDEDLFWRSDHPGNLYSLEAEHIATPDTAIRTPEEQAINKELHQMIAEALSRLTAREQAVMERRFPIDGSKKKTTEQTSQELGIPSGTIQFIQRNALNKLGAILQIPIKDYIQTSWRDRVENAPKSGKGGPDL